MSIFSDLLSPVAAAPIEAIGNVLDKIFTSDHERLDKKIILERILLQPSIAQTEINKVEASHRSAFVAGWRPFVGWVCGFSLAYAFIIRDWIIWGIVISGKQIEMPPNVAIEHLIAIMVPLLGLGAYRTIEKSRGISK